LTTRRFKAIRSFSVRFKTRRSHPEKRIGEQNPRNISGEPIKAACMAATMQLPGGKIVRSRF
jgi:hypothetical protein